MDVEILKTLPALFATAAIPIKVTATSTTQAQTARAALRLTFINGLGYEDGKIIVTPHGFLAGKEAAEEKASIEAYKKEYADYWKDIIGSDGDFTLKEEKED